MKKSRVAAILTALSLSVGIAVVGSNTANAAKGDGHFILISTHGAPLWSASATVYAGNGDVVQNREVEIKSGGRELWEFTDDGDDEDGSIDVKIYGTNDLSVSGLPLNRDHCFLVNAVGVSRYTGDSVTGGCNSD
jgi:hypothetical protein